MLPATHQVGLPRALNASRDGCSPGQPVPVPHLPLSENLCVGKEIQAYELNPHIPKFRGGIEINIH